MTPVSRQNVTIWGMANSLTPIEGPQALKVSIAFASDTNFLLDQNALLNPARVFSNVQSVFIDASSTANSVSLINNTTGQTITVKGRTQGYYPVVAPNNWSFTLNCTDVAAIINLFLLNFATDPGQWATQ